MDQNAAQERKPYSLADDKKILSCLETTSTKLFENVRKSQNVLENLKVETERTRILFDGLLSDFNALSTRQFIENRVFEDEDVSKGPPVPKVPNENVKPSKEQKDAEMMAAIKFAVDQGLATIDRFYERIEFKAEDFDESDDPTFKTEPVYKPRNLYCDRPLPFVYGSEEYRRSRFAGIRKEKEDTSNFLPSEPHPTKSVIDRNDKQILAVSMPRATAESGDILPTSISSSGPGSDNSGLFSSSVKSDLIQHAVASKIVEATKPAVEDFQRNLDAKLAALNKSLAAAQKVNINKTASEPPIVEQVQKPIVNKEALNKSKLNIEGSTGGPPPLFDEDSESDDNDLFGHEPGRSRRILSKGIFDEEEEESEDDLFIGSSRQIDRTPASRQTAASSLKKNDQFPQTVPTHEPVVHTSIKNGMTEKRNEVSTVAPPKELPKTARFVEAKKAKNLFEEDEEEDDDNLFSPKTKVINEAKHKLQTEPDIKNLSQNFPTLKRPVTSIFDSGDEEPSDLFVPSTSTAISTNDTKTAVQDKGHQNSQKDKLIEPKKASSTVGMTEESLAEVMKSGLHKKTADKAILSEQSVIESVESSTSTVKGTTRKSLVEALKPPSADSDHLDAHLSSHVLSNVNKARAVPCNRRPPTRRRHTGLLLNKESSLPSIDLKPEDQNVQSKLLVSEVISIDSKCVDSDFLTSDGSSNLLFKNSTNNQARTLQKSDAPTKDSSCPTHLLKPNPIMSDHEEQITPTVKDDLKNETSTTLPPLSVQSKAPLASHNLETDNLSVEPKVPRPKEQSTTSLKTPSTDSRRKAANFSGLSVPPPVKTSIFLSDEEDDDLFTCSRQPTGIDQKKTTPVTQTGAFQPTDSDQPISCPAIDSSSSDDDDLFKKLTVKRKNDKVEFSKVPSETVANFGIVKKASSISIKNTSSLPHQDSELKIPTKGLFDDSDSDLDLFK